MGGGPAGRALAVALRCAIMPNCAGGVSNLARVLKHIPWKVAASWWCGSVQAVRLGTQQGRRAERARKQGSEGKAERALGRK